MKYEAKQNGRTGDAMLAGHKVKHRVLGLGEHFHSLTARDNNNRNNFDGEWQDGYLAGVIARTSAHFITKDDQLFKCQRCADGWMGRATTRTSLNIWRPTFRVHNQGGTTMKADISRGNGQ